MKENSKQAENSQLTRKVTVRFTPEEYHWLHKQFEKTTKRKLSEYIRSVLLQEPIAVYTRNQSLDDLVAELIVLRNELSQMGNNWNQAVKKLHTMDSFPEMKIWVLVHENSRKQMLEKVAHIQEKIDQIARLW